MSKVSIPTLIIALLVVLILAVYMCTFQVAFYEVAVKVRLGQADEHSVVRDANIYFRWPWPVERVIKYDVRLRTMDTPETELKTSDGKNMIVGCYAVWKIADPLQFYKRVKTVKEAENQMRSRITQYQSAAVGQRTLADFVNLDRAALERSYDGFLASILGTAETTADGKVVPGSGLRQSLKDEYGIDIVEIGVRRISLPKEVTQEVFNSMIQDRKTLAERYRQEGKSRAAAIKARAEGDAKQILAFADRKAQEIKSAGIQASTRILSQIASEDREFFEWLRWLDALKASLKQKTTIFLDQNSPLFAPFVQPPVTPTTAPAREPR